MPPTPPVSAPSFQRQQQQLPPPPIAAHPGPAASATSLGPAVSYPYPVLPRAPGEDGDGDGTEGGARGHGRAPRLSLTLANWNPETDGDLFDAGSERGSVAPRRGAGGDAG